MAADPRHQGHLGAELARSPELHHIIERRTVITQSTLTLARVPMPAHPLCGCRWTMHHEEPRTTRAPDRRVRVSGR